MNVFQEGEYVTLAFERVRVAVVEARALKVEVPGVDSLVLVPTHRSDGKPLTGISVERAAPVEWPPRHGDLWRDRGGRLWAGIYVAPDDDEDACTFLILLDGRSRRDSYDPDQVLESHGPVTLVHRLPSTDTAVSS